MTTPTRQAPRGGPRGGGASNRGWSGRGDSNEPWRGRGRGAYSRGGGNESLRSHGSGSGRGGFSTEDKERIMVAARPTTLQVAAESTDDIIKATSASDNIRNFALFALKKDFLTLRGQRQMRMFVNSCLLNLSNHHSVDTSGVLADLAKPSGLARLTEIMSAQMSIDAGDSKDLVSFQYVILPLIGVLTRERVCQTTMTSESGLIYATVYLHFRRFLDEGVLHCIDELLARGSLQDQNPTTRLVLQDPSVCRVPSLECAMLGVLRLVYQLIRRKQDARIEMAPLVDRLHKQVVRCISLPRDSPESNFLMGLLAMEMDRLCKIIADAQDRVIEPIDFGILTTQRSKKLTGPNLVYLLRTYDPPGHLSENGSRHDNDHAEISEISILPTQEEVTCQRAPFLPSNGIPDAPHFLPPGWKRQIDIHFRLYREDMLDSMRKGITAFLTALERTDVGKEGILLKHKELKKHLDNDVSLNVYGSVRFLGMTCTHRVGGSVEVVFAQPPQALGANKRRRAEFWERSKRRLMQGSLVCIASRAWPSDSDDTGSPNFHMILGVVSSRDIGVLANDENEASIQISLTDPTLYLLTLSTEHNAGTPNQWFLIESTGAFYEAYRPVLKALQNCVPATLPFGKYLAPTKEELNEMQNTKATVDPPLYTRVPGFEYDLSVLLDGDQRCRLNVMDALSLRVAVDMLQQHSTLDNTQSLALVETLCREVALISGPPGTGKTRIGVDLMRVLLHNKERMGCGPIICICFTNHALDQFLEHLLDKGIDSIARIGFRSKSERLEQYNLESLLKVHDRPFTVRQTLRDVREQRESLSEEIKSLEEALRSEYLSWEYLGPILMSEHPDIWEGILAGEDYGDSDGEQHDLQYAQESEGMDDDFEMIVRKKRMDPYLEWATGQDIKRKTKKNEETQRLQQDAVEHPNMFAALEDKDVKMLLESPLVHIPQTNRPLQQLQNDIDVWEMSLDERKRLVESWRHAAQGLMMTKMAQLLKSVDTITKRESSAYDQIRCDILRGVSVIGMTTSGAAKSQSMIEALAPKIILCEEAGEVLESHILATLSPSTQHLILIGDHKQLRPQIELYDLSSDSRRGQHYNLDLSLFERLVSAQKNALPASELTVQRRMRPEISSLIRNTLYPNLEDGNDVSKYPSICGMSRNLFFMDHSHPEDSRDQYGMQSYANAFEVNMVDALAQYLIKNGYNQPGEIAVLTPYLGQLSRFRDVLRDRYELLIDERDQEQLDQTEQDNSDNSENDGPTAGTSVPLHVNQHTTVGVKRVAMNNHLTLRTIDNYQGEEAKIVIISLVRNNAGQDNSGSSGGIGFVKSPNRTNVLLSRAQHGMFLLGNASLMRQEKNGIWPKVIDELDRFDRIGKGFPIVCKNHPDMVNIVDSPRILKTVAPNGGCTMACSRNMPCGHVCPHSCHPDDERHQLVKCFQPCTRLHPVCQHVCPKLCGEKCGDCMESMPPMVLSCDHVYETPKCYQKQNPSRIICTVKANKQLPTCEHERAMECYQDPVSRCEKALKCGHQCPSVCGEACPPQKFCVECKDEKTMATVVDFVLSETLGEIDVNIDPVLVLSCGHALTMSSMDGMMGLDDYYKGDVNPETGVTDFRSKAPLPDGEVKQVSCHLCRKPIITLLRYGRRVKYAQLSMRLKKFQISQAKAVKDAQDAFNKVCMDVEKRKEQFVHALKRTEAEEHPDPPRDRARKLAKLLSESDKFPYRIYKGIKVYGIPKEHEKAWIKLLEQATVCFRNFSRILQNTQESPPRRLFEAAVAHLYRLKTAPTYDLNNDLLNYPDLPAETTSMSDVIQACILECGLPVDGHGGSSYVDSLQGRVSVLLLVLAQAFVALNTVSAKTGWYWFVEDLIQYTLAHVEILFEAAKSGKFERYAAYARANRMDLMYKHMQWIGIKPMPSEEAARATRLELIDKTLEQFMTDHKELKDNCPRGIKAECLQRAEALEEKIVDAYKAARNESAYKPLTEEEKFQVYVAVQQSLTGGGHWYRCPNNHTYIIANCGMANQESTCPECGAPVGGTGYRLRAGNTLDEEFEAMHQRHLA
ncbi:hypothetical protein BGX28_009613 [Mortierella sp. GBA30]|nr:hypothetical protein BGX28_009613 [Mortierella sp. GBA30]